jgi:hypothetical protein
MTCQSCLKARAAAKAAVGAIAQGDIRQARHEARNAASALKDKAAAESQRIRAMLRKS